MKTVYKISGDLIRISEAAAILGIHPATLKDWEKKNIIIPIRTAGGHRRYKKSVVEAMLTNGQSRLVDERRD